MSSTLNRIIQMDALIRAGAYPSVALLRERFEVSERTVRADLAFMRERLNAPSKHDRPGGRPFLA
jgi:predicted DNA-binding transcriptional regulator YafY